MGNAGHSESMRSLLTQNNGLCGDAVGWDHQILSRVLRFVHASSQVITRFSARVYETALPRLLLKQRGVSRQMRERATLIGTQCYRNKPLRIHRPIRIKRTLRLIRTLRLRIKKTLVSCTQCRKIGVLTPVDDDWPALPIQEPSLTHFHLADIDYFAWNRRYTLRAISKRRKKDVKHCEYAHVNHRLDGDPKFKSALLCFCCRLFHGFDFLQYSLFSVRYS